MSTDDIDGVDIRVGIPLAQINQLMAALELHGLTADQRRFVLLHRPGPPARKMAGLEAVLWSSTHPGDDVVLRVRLRDRTQIPLLRTLLNEVPDHTLTIVEEWCDTRHRLVATLTAHPVRPLTKTGAYPAPARPSELQQEVLRRYCGWPDNPNDDVVRFPVRERVWQIRRGFIEFTARHWIGEPVTGSGGPPYRGLELSRLVGTDEAAFVVPVLTSFLHQQGLESQTLLEPLEFSVRAT